MQRGLFRLFGAVARSRGVAQWLSAQTGDVGALARECFGLLRESGSDVRELMHDGCATVCVQDAAFAYVGAFKAHVTIGFFQGTELPDPGGLLEGRGKYMRHVKIRPSATVETLALAKLIRAAHRDVVARLAVSA